MKYEKIRKIVLEAILEAVDQGLIHGTSEQIVCKTVFYSFVEMICCPFGITALLACDCTHKAQVYFRNQVTVTLCGGYHRLGNIRHTPHQAETAYVL